VEGVVQKIPGRGKPIRTVIRDKLVDKSWPKFLHPFPLSDKYFLVSSKPSQKSPWGIYLVDVFDNILPIYVRPKFDLFEPIPLAKMPRPPAVPDRINPASDKAVVYLDDIYAGEGLKGVPRGTVKKLRIFAYHYGYPGMAGPDKIGCGGPWEVMRILGTVDVHEDGSAMFRVPANTPLSVQPLDQESKAVQLMRSWFTAMPGETVSCVGCHEQSKQIPALRVSWQQAMDFCRWLSRQTGMKFTLPTEAQWEYACRAGSQSPLSYGEMDADFSKWANVADKSLSIHPGPTGGLESKITAHFGKGILESAVYGGNILCDIHFDDGAIATSNVGGYQPNALGLYDMHGNACEWTRTTYKPYPYKASEDRNYLDEQNRKVVRGGSWCDRPKRCRSAFRLSYPAWQRVHNVGFRVVSEIEPPEKEHTASANRAEGDETLRNSRSSNYGDN